ncbi:MAG: hypothetical protein M1831_006476 [Alyxoria varia]|nr:MAG: hypothetical protein M1831_006476 [Alyxoria varia]
MSSPSQADPDHPDEVASKVLRRAHVSKMTRALQDRLALANIKISHGWQDRSIESLKPELDYELKRKRGPGEMTSEISSSPSGHCFLNVQPTSSPLTAPMLSDELRSGSSVGSFKKRKTEPPLQRSMSNSQILQKSTAKPHPSSSWKTAHHLPESSPSFRSQTRKSAMLPPNTSFHSETSTIPDSPSASEDDDQDIPLHSFQYPNDHISSSPPRTPSPDLARSARLHSGSMASRSVEKHHVKEGADLLLYLAASPSPVTKVNRTPMPPPSTPPAKNTPLPSSMMSTPGGQIINGFNVNTPSPAFNFADFVNVTPSPAPAQWARTPGQLKTPVAAKETRRRLIFNSPNPGSASRTPGKKAEGCGIDLGGELLR